MPHLRHALLVLVVALAGCAGLDEAQRNDLDRAATALDAQLDAPGLLAATAILHHAQHERYPSDAAALLGSAAARETGLQQLGLSALTLSPDSDGLTMRYTLLPTQGDPSDRLGSISVAASDTSATYNVRIRMERIVDPDLATRPLPLAQEGQYAVVRANVTLCADVETLRARAGQNAGDPPLDGSTSYTVTFTPADDTPAPAALQQGVTVTLPR